MSTHPGPDAAALHVNTSQGTVGPMSRRELKAKVEAGEISGDAHIWYQELGEWTPLSQVDGLLDGLDDAAASTAAAPATTSPSAAAALPANEDDALDAVFGSLVKQSWEYYEAHAFATRVDEVFLGALITASLDNGWSLIDLTSDGTNHYVRFENLTDHSRLIFKLSHLTGSLTAARVLGQRASVVVGYGEKVKNFGKIWSAVQAEYKSGYIRTPEPGTITVDGDVGAGYVYVQVDLFWNIDDYIRPDYSVDYAVLDRHVDGCTHALRKYLRGRFA
jgi:hypothetical protein